MLTKFINRSFSHQNFKAESDLVVAFLLVGLALTGGSGCGQITTVQPHDAAADLPDSGQVDRAPVDTVASDVPADDGPAGMMVWPSTASKLVAENHGGGFVGPAPAGSGCPALQQGTYTLTTTDKMLVWHVCQMSAGTLYQYVDGNRTLSNPEYTNLVEVLRAVTVSTRTGCGADKPTLTLTVTSLGGERTYKDSFYACEQSGIFVDNIDDVFSTLQDLAK